MDKQLNYVILLVFLWLNLYQTSISNADITNFGKQSTPKGFPKDKYKNVCNVSTTFRITASCMHAATKNDNNQYDFVSAKTQHGTYDTGAMFRYNNSGSGNQNIPVCIPLTPQLYNCDLKKFGPECYQLESHKLSIPESNFSAELGDYYLDADRNAFVCSEPITPSKNLPRCNQVEIANGQFTFNEDGSLHIHVTNTTIRNPSYQNVDNGTKINVCYPLSINFLNCHVESAMIIYRYLYDKKTELKIFYRSYNKLYSVDEYYSINNGADIIACTPEFPLYVVILSSTYAGIRCVSIFPGILITCHLLMAPKLTMHNRCLIAYNICGMTYFLVCVVSVMECYSYYVLKYLTSNMTYMWLGITCHDTWKFFSKIQTSPNHNSGANTRYKYYCIIGFGIPIVMCVIILIINKYCYMDGVPLLLPFVGLHKNCWFRDKWIAFSLHYALHSGILLINAVFFVSITCYIRNGSKGTELVNKRRKQQIYIVCLKLYLLMGISMIIEGIIWSVQEHYNFPYWCISEVFTSTQGLAICFVESSKPGTIQLMRRRFITHFQKLTTKISKSPVERNTSL